MVTDEFLPLLAHRGLDTSPAARDYAQSLTPRPAGGFTPGGHDIAFWNRVAPEQLAFIGSHFA